MSKSLSHTLVGKTPIGNIPTYVQHRLLRLDKPGERILFEGTPFYVGQTVADALNPEVIGIVNHIHVNCRVKEPYIHCMFGKTIRVLPPRSLSIPIVNTLELEKRGDDFFDSLRIGDAIDEEIRDDLYNMLPRLMEKPNYFQVSGVVGIVNGHAGRSVLTPLYLTVKRFGGKNSPWRYTGHCERGDDVHLFTCIA